jgi:branched-chain amino acid transport system permease protein
MVASRVTAVALSLGVAVVPLVGSSYVRGLLVLCGAYVIAVAGLALVVGHAGQLSLAHGAFFALGAYAFAIGTAQLDWAPIVALVAGVVSVGGLAWVLGRLLSRLQGHFFALGTLAFASIVVVALQQFGDWTGGPSGISTTDRLVPRTPLSRDLLRAWVAWAVAGLVLVMFERLVRSRVGVVLTALRTRELGVAASGIDPLGPRLGIFVLAACLAAIGGALYADYLTFLSPAGFDILLGIQFVVMVVVGGSSSWRGPLLGAVGVTLMVEVLRVVVPLVVPGARGPVELVGLSLALGGVTLVHARRRV